MFFRTSNYIREWLHIEKILYFFQGLLPGMRFLWGFCHNVKLRVETKVFGFRQKRAKFSHVTLTIFKRVIDIHAQALIRCTVCPRQEDKKRENTDSLSP